MLTKGKKKVYFSCKAAMAGAIGSLELKKKKKKPDGRWIDLQGQRGWDQGMAAAACYELLEMPRSGGCDT